MITNNELKLLEVVHKAIYDNFYPQVRMLLEEADININCQDGLGSTPLMLAVINGNLLTGRLLIDKGADPDIKDINGKTVHDILKEKSRSWKEFVQAASTPEVKDKAYGLLKAPDWKKTLPAPTVYNHIPNVSEMLSIECSEGTIILVDSKGKKYCLLEKPETPWQKAVDMYPEKKETIVIHTPDKELIIVDLADRTYCSFGKPTPHEESQKYHFWVTEEGEKPNYPNQIK